MSLLWHSAGLKASPDPEEKQTPSLWWWGKVTLQIARTHNSLGLVGGVGGGGYAGVEVIILTTYYGPWFPLP